MTHQDHPLPDEPAPVRITGVPTDLADHPAVRKIARAILSIAARQLDEEAQPTTESSGEVAHD